MSESKKVPELELRNHAHGVIHMRIDAGIVQLDLTQCKPPLIITVSHRVR